MANLRAVTLYNRLNILFRILSDNIDSTLLQSDFLYTANVTIIQRRGSVPCENLSSTNRNNCNGKTKNRKKMLRRRSSGGAEILCPIVAESEPSSSGSSSWYRFKRSEPSKNNRSDLDMLLTRRRGSLPVEVLAVSHSGKYAAKKLNDGTIKFFSAIFNPTSRQSNSKTFNLVWLQANCDIKQPIRNVFLIFVNWTCKHYCKQIICI